MNQPFFITGLPCSRTAWLANLFTTGNVMCHHDLLGRVGGMERFATAIREDGWGQPSTFRVGDADSGLLACYPQVKKLWPIAPWVLVIRKFDDAWDSLCRFVASGPWQDKLACTWELRQEMLKQWETARAQIIQDARCMEIPFESLARTDTIECLWKHCAPGARFDRRRAEWLQTMNVRPHQANTEARPKFSLIRELYPVEAI